MKRLTVLAIAVATLLGGWAGVAMSQSPKSNADHKPYEKTANKLIDLALQQRFSYGMLRELTQNIGPRLSGSPQAAAAVEWARQQMKKLGFENVRLQPVTVPHWVRGEIEQASIVNSAAVGSYPLNVCALGGSVGTPPLGVTGEVIEVHSIDELNRLGEKVKNKIVFFNRPMDATLRNTFAAYGGAVPQRTRGASAAGKLGAIAVLVRSMTLRLDDVPHTGATHYEKGVRKIPAAAVSTVDAEYLSRLLKREPGVRVNLRLSCKTLPDEPSFNVMGEILGSEKPQEVIVLGGHLDSWDKGQGAHDDGAGCVQAMEALRLIKAMNLKPARTLRAVLFMNEENGLRGGRAYARWSGEKNIKHIAAIESDRGGFVPVGFSVDAAPEILPKISRWGYLLASIRANRFRQGGSGADISPLKKFGVPGIGLVVDSNRYFDYHHSDSDTFDKVNERELELGAAAMAILAYVLAMEGV